MRSPSNTFNDWFCLKKEKNAYSKNDFFIFITLLSFFLTFFPQLVENEIFSEARTIGPQCHLLANDYYIYEPPLRSEANKYKFSSQQWQQTLTSSAGPENCSFKSSFHLWLTEVPRLTCDWLSWTEKEAMDRVKPQFTFYTKLCATHTLWTYWVLVCLLQVNQCLDRQGDQVLWK